MNITAGCCSYQCVPMLLDIFTMFTRWRLWKWVICEEKGYWFLLFLTPYRDWQGCVLHFLTWGSGRFTRWQSLSFTTVMVLLIIRVQDTIVFRSPTSKIKYYSEKHGRQWLRRKPCQLINQISLLSSNMQSIQTHKPCKLSYLPVLSNLCTVLFFPKKTYKSLIKLTRNQT